MTNFLQSAASYLGLTDSSGNRVWRVGYSKPENKPCPKCGTEMFAQTPDMPSDWSGADEYDHYWCDECGEAYDFDEVKP